MASVLTGEFGILPSCFLEELGLLWVQGLPWLFSFWPITDNQSFMLGDKFSLPLWLLEASLSSMLQSVCTWLAWEVEQMPDRPRLFFVTGCISATQSHFSSQSADGPSLVSSLRLTRRSFGDVLLTTLWEQGLSTLLGWGFFWSGEPWLGTSHCLIVDGVLWQTEAVLTPWDKIGEVVLEGRGRAAPLGAQEASRGEVRAPRLSVLWALAGVVSTRMEGP